LLQGILQLGFGPLALQLRGSTRGEDSDEVHSTFIALHRLVINDRDMPHDSPSRIEHRDTQVTLGFQLDQASIQGKEFDQTLAIMADLSFDHLSARRIGHIEFETVAEVISLPESQRPGMLSVIALGDESMADTQSFGHVFHHRWEKIASGCRRSAD